MAGNNASVGISQNRIYKAELTDGSDDLIYLLLGMRARVAESGRSVSTGQYVTERGGSPAASEEIFMWDIQAEEVQDGLRRCGRA